MDVFVYIVLSFGNIDQGKSVFCLAFPSKLLLQWVLESWCLVFLTETNGGNIPSHIPFWGLRGTQSQFLVLASVFQKLLKTIMIFPLLSYLEYLFTILSFIPT